MSALLEQVNADTEHARELVKSFYEGGARGEITAFAPHLAEDFELFVPPSFPGAVLSAGSNTSTCSLGWRRHWTSAGCVT